MQEIAFYDVGCAEVRGVRRLAVPFRRLVRRILRPIFQHLANLLNHLRKEQGRLTDEVRQLREEQVRWAESLKGLPEHLGQMDERMQAILYFGWDYVALVRRLAALESQVEALRPTEADGESAGEPPAAIAFRSPRSQELRTATALRAHELDPATEPRERAC